jgi:hypothetical protein
MPKTALDMFRHTLATLAYRAAKILKARTKSIIPIRRGIPDAGEIA